MIRLFHTRAVRFTASLLSLVAALGLTLTARPLFATTAYAVFLAAVMFSSWYGGLTPAFLVVLMSVVALDRYFASPELSGVLSRDDVVQLVVFLLVASLISYLSRKQQRAEAALRASHDDLEQRIAERTAALRNLSGQLLHLQDEERRRTSRLLHETVVQDLAALKMDLSILKRSGTWNGGNAKDVLQEAVSLTDRCIRQTRTVSYLLHPPLLEEAGLASALQWYCAGFEQRSGIKTELIVPPDLVRLTRDLETTAFRFVQECLTNVHRHSGSLSVRIVLRETPNQLKVEVRDRGHGMPLEIMEGTHNSSVHFGVGIMGLDERLKQTGGSMKIETSGHGTTVTATLPSVSNHA